MNEWVGDIIGFVILFFLGYLPYRVGRAEGKLSRGTNLTFHAPEGTEYEIISTDGNKQLIRAKSKGEAEVSDG